MSQVVKSRLKFFETTTPKIRRTRSVHRADWIRIDCVVVLDNGRRGQNPLEAQQVATVARKQLAMNRAVLAQQLNQYGGSGASQRYYMDRYYGPNGVNRRRFNPAVGFRRN